MAMMPGKPSRPRRSLLAGLMGLVLAATVAGAWVLQAVAGRRVRAAAETLQQIRTRGLGKYWPAQDTTNWYIIRDDARAVGWRAEFRAPAHAGGFIGTSLEVRGNSYAAESWSLSADASEGWYEAVSASQNAEIFTRIDLGNGEVKVYQELGGRKGPPPFRAASPAPENYLPEGMWELVVGQVADTGADAQFKLVFNERPNHRGYVDYGTLRFRALGGQTDRRVRVSGTRAGESYARTYTVDATGRITEVSLGGGLRLVSASMQQVARFYPRARALLANRVKQLPRQGS